MMSKTVIVTGASTGIGKAIAKTFLDRGHNVIMNSANFSNLENTYKEFGCPGNAKLVVADISERATGQQLAAAAIESFGSIDILINNAGIFVPKPFLDVDEAELDSFLEVNLKGTFFASQAVIKKMIVNGGGAIVNIGTALVDHAIGGFPSSAPVVSKAGIHALTRQLAAEFGKQNIRVNTVAPGVIRSTLNAKLRENNVYSMKGSYLINRVGETSDIAECVYFLATSRFITGEIIRVDGGFAAGRHHSLA